MMSGFRRLLLSTVAVGLAGVVATAAWFALSVLPVVTGHKAKVLCSGVFVSKRAPAAVLYDLEVDDLSMLRYVDASIDLEAQTVTTRALGVERRAIHRKGLGCALALDDLVPPPMPVGDAGIGGSDRSSAPALPWRTVEGATREPGAPLDAVIARAFDEPDPLHPRRTRAVVVLRGGSLVAERYAAGIGPDTPLPGWSMSKSVLNALAGVLVREGRLTLNTPVLIPEWHQPGDPRAAITLDHLLRMSSGLRFDEDQDDPGSDVMRMLFGVGNIAGFVTSRDAAFAPGTRWAYSNASSNVISVAIRNVLRDRATYLAFPGRALFRPLGMSSAVLETDAAGNFIGSSYMYASAHDWARFGMLFLRDGMWNGTRVLPPGWVDYTRTPSAADATKRYGAHFWLEIPPEYAGADPRLPAPALHAAGHEGQFVTIVPSRDLVIVRLGRTRYPQAWDQATFVREVMATLDRTNE